MSIPYLNFGDSTKKNVDILNNAIDTINEPGINFLDNPDFKINQRGESEYTTTGYTVDRWVSQSSFTITPLAGGGIRITPVTAITKTLTALYQDIPVSGTMLGKDYTLTSNVTVTNEYADMQLVAYDSSSSVVKVSSSIYLLSGINSVTISSIPSTATKIRVRISIGSGAQAENITELSWIKLEMGGVATPFCTPDPASEIIKCQRYYIEYNSYKTVYCTVGHGFGYTSSTAVIFIDMPTQMRKIPTLSASGSWGITSNLIGNSEIPVTIDSIYTSNSSVNKLVLKCTAQDGYSITQGQTYTLRSINDNTARLSLSADL